ncbi:hypothetical protein DICPUDRAFT_83763 [Dictyostelium purpureum]|uniref:DUF4460 domain-containing protein n=1 Tax=Dictyostelium purpureum TaxID=5786 RepID=F1A0J5_DICPU|nr:uncharacterized protein DICPUDRAFT_83763 [Dictyostelium purpureum]EGC30284.1 hypothetical protein DICPUDRAFT_83763 [Dictyostelium purpureum]|eukprot:XP_003293187.1 hypothetical protein DICPUDRAFT_83763 [Dictyostelium purpureum]
MIKGNRNLLFIYSNKNYTTINKNIKFKPQNSNFSLQTPQQLHNNFSKNLLFNSFLNNNKNNSYNIGSVNNINNTNKTFSKKFYCTQSSSNNNDKSNKLILKKFFLKVHPDIFYQFPKIKNNNDESLRLFLGFLGEVKSEKILKKEYNLKFYYQDENLYANEDEVPSVSVQFDVERSASSDSFENLVYLLRDAQIQIKSLFKQMGIKEEFILHHLITESANGIEEESLLDFIKNISFVAREQQNSFTEQEREIDLMYTYFYMEHKVRVLFQDHDFPLKNRKDHLKKLEKILNKIAPRKESNHNVIQEIFDKSNYSRNENQMYTSYRSNFNNNQHHNQNNNQSNDEDLNDTNNSGGFGSRVSNQQQLFSEFGVFGGKNKANFAGWEHIKSGYITPESNPKSDECNLRDRLEGVSIVFSKSLNSGVDSEGRLILNSNKKPSEWSKTLKTFKPSQIVTNIQKCKQRKSQEKELSKALKIGSLYTDYDYQNSQAYLEFLDKLFTQFKQFLMENNGFNSATNSLDEVNIKVIKEEQSNTIEPWKFNSKLAGIYIPLTSNYKEISDFLQSNHAQIKKEMERHRINMRNLAQLELIVKRQFRLARLKKIDDTIGMNEMVICLKRLIINNTPFLPYLYGMKLIVGYENKINFDGSIIIKWDFDV